MRARLVVRVVARHCACACSAPRLCAAVERDSDGFLPCDGLAHVSCLRSFVDCLRAYLVVVICPGGECCRFLIRDGRGGRT